MNMSSSTENAPTPIVQEFNLLPVPSPTSISDLENSHMNMSTAENVPTPIIREFNLLPLQSPITISDLENTHMNMSSSTENIPTPAIQEFNLEPVPSQATISENSQTLGSEDILIEPTTYPSPPKQENSQTLGSEDILIEPATSPTSPKQGSSRIEKDTSSSPKMSQPSVLESFGPQHVVAPRQDSANSEKVTDYSSENSHLPGLCSEKFIPDIVPSPTHFPAINFGNNACSSPQTSAPSGWKHTNACPSPLEDNMDISPNCSHPHPGWDDIGPGSAPPASAIPDYSENIENVDISPDNSHLPPGWDDAVPGSAPHTPAMQGSLKPDSSSGLEKDMGSSPEMSQPPGWEKFGSQHIPAPVPGMGQVVCGSCRQLLSYPQGTTRVKCPCCQTINFVLEEHQVGIVKCAKCWAWLMYPHGAPAVRCSACHFVTQIGEDNARPPLSVQQNRSFVSPGPLQ